ncbi:MAG TPA: hypothetical protein VF164_11590 [Trueperaceae bacterium]
MTDLEDILARSWAHVEGCRVVAVAGMDGLLIERHPAKDDDPVLAGAPEPETLAHIVAEVTTLFGVASGAMSRELGSPVSELVALGETGGYLARRINPDLFCLFVTGPSADLTNVRSEAEELARELTGALV